MRPQATACCAAGTLVATSSGLRAIETLQPGDRVLTRDNGAQPVIASCKQQFCRTGDPVPVEVPTGVLGAAHILRLAPTHRVLLQSGRIAITYAAREVFVTAAQLVGRWGIQPAANPAGSYHALTLPRHEIILINGVWVESTPPRESAAPSTTSDPLAVSGGLARPCLQQSDVNRLFHCVPVRLSA